MEQLHPEVEFSFGQVAKQPHEKTLTFTAVGDVFMPGTVHWSNGDCPAVDEEIGKRVLDQVAPYFLKSDVTFCNLEAAISDKGKPVSGRAAAFRSYPGMEHILKKAGISIVSLANNHTQDYGWEALNDTIERLDKVGIGHSGAGKNIMQARKPAILEIGGMTVGLLSYTANVNTPMGFKASAEREGLNPMRISPFFLPDHVNDEDIETMHEDVGTWKRETDFLAVSCHWGLSEGGTHTVTRHQEVIAHHAVDAGADLVIGHHSHALQAIEIYKEKAILYSLGNFVFSLEEDFPRESMLFQCVFSRHKIHQFKFLPSFMSKQNEPEVFHPEKGRGPRVVALMSKLCAKYGVALQVKSETGEVVLFASR
ncbi:MAG: CapA family protein [Chloroflexi bacterium]|nr:CapA family protein [Chloroflexota bacterium]